MTFEEIKSILLVKNIEHTDEIFELLTNNFEVVDVNEVCKIYISIYYVI